MVEESAETPPVYATDLPPEYAHLTEPLGASVLRATELVGVNLRWLCAWLLLGKAIDLEHCSSDELDREVKTCVRIITDDHRGGSERLAREYGL